MMGRSNPREPRRKASFETVEFEALLDPVDAAPQVVEAIEVPPALAPTRPAPSRFDAAGTNDDRLPIYSKRTRRRR